MAEKKTTTKSTKGKATPTRKAAQSKVKANAITAPKSKADKNLDKASLRAARAQRDRAVQASVVGIADRGDGGETIGGTPAAFAELMRAETKRWAEVVRGAGMRVD